MVLKYKKVRPGAGIARPGHARQRGGGPGAPCAATKALPCSPWGVR